MKPTKKRTPKKPELSDEQKLNALRAKRNAVIQERARVRGQISNANDKLNTIMSPHRTKARRAVDKVWKAQSREENALSRKRAKATLVIQKKINAYSTKMRRKIEAIVRDNAKVSMSSYKKARAEAAKINAALGSVSTKLAKTKGLDTKPLHAKRDRLYNDEVRLDKEISDLVNKAKLPPPKGAFTFYKKVYQFDINGYQKRSIICTMEVPAKAKRLCGDHNKFKCRVSGVKVVKLEWYSSDRPDEAQPTVGFSAHDRSFKYVVGEYVKPTHKFDPNRHDVCSSGIHGYMTRVGAEQHC